MKKGFTVLELIVVIGLMAVLTAMTVPAMRSIMENNRTSLCLGNMQKVARALKAYSVDYQGLPPVWIAETTNAADPYDEMRDSAAVPTGDPAVSTPPPASPLLVLYSEGYLKDRTVLHCPRDRAHDDATQAAFYQSYTGREADDTATEKQVKIIYKNDVDSGDAWNGTGIAINRYRYMPCRIWKPFPKVTPSVTPSAYDGYRELNSTRDCTIPPMKLVTINGTQYWTPMQDRNWWPSDRTIIAWCPFHADLYAKDGVGQYLVLFWDGSAVMKPRTLFEKGTGMTPPPPTSAWEVSPND